MKSFDAAVGVAALLVSTVVFAFDNEPDGFRGIKWGTPLSANAKDMVLDEKGKDENWYRRKGDKMKIGGAQLKSVKYGYRNPQGNLYAVFISTAGVSNQSALMSAFETQFGKPGKPNRFIDEYWWWGAATTISLKCNSINKDCNVFMFSNEIMNEIRSKKKKEAEDAKKDF